LTYNAAGRLADVIDPGARSVHYGYDSAGDLTSFTDVGDGVTEYAYDGDHQLTVMTDPRQGETTNVYDSSNRVVSQQERDGGIMTFDTPLTRPRSHPRRESLPGRRSRTSSR
jgi:YD repeat-containing protein